MRALIWIVEDTWRATVAQAAALLAADAEITLLHVAPGDPEQVAGAARHGLLGRRHPGPPGEERLRAISQEGAEQLLADAVAVLGRDDARTDSRRGRVEREVVDAAQHADVLVLARDGDHARLGPRSLGPPARFVVDHAPCTVLLVWADDAPRIETIPPPPPEPHRRHH